MINPKDSSDTMQALKNFSLSKINEDRAKHGLSPLLQSNNTAQIHANELLQTKTISHLTIDGFKALHAIFFCIALLAMFSKT
ncbi:MAG: hypothetical protein P0116_15360 [Candidatus Nitrosocosmicus sp.]|nr:hypothetical protein [Candidatus Nitrosocosmicus sp.]